MPLFTEPGCNLHPAKDTGIDDFQASRSPDDKYRTTPLRGLFTRSKGGFYHDGRFADLNAVVDHYEEVLKFNLNPDQQRDLVEYLKSLELSLSRLTGTGQRDILSTFRQPGSPYP